MNCSICDRPAPGYLFFNHEQVCADCFSKNVDLTTRAHRPTSTRFVNGEQHADTCDKVLISEKKKCSCDS